jgi:signal transduction histidine kinase
MLGDWNAWRLIFWTPRKLKVNLYIWISESLVLNELISDSMNEVKNQIDNDNVELEYHPIDITVRADRVRIAQVLYNLLSNAIKFTNGGTISISSKRDDDRVVVSVKDMGIGIDLEIMPKLFTKFVTKSANGTGLRLYISKSIIEAHGGKIWAENNPDRKGATFSFTLPNTSR